MTKSSIDSVGLSIIILHSPVDPAAARPVA